MFIAPSFTQAQLSLLQPNEIPYPYSDEYMVYDGMKHQYRATRALFEEHGVDLQAELPGNNPEKINNFLHELQLKAYLKFYNSGKSTRNQINYLIAKRGLRTMEMDEYRETIKELMYVEGCYLIANGDISAVSGVDLDTMQNVSADVIRNQNRDWHKDALDLMKMLGLCYAKRYDFYPQGKDINW